MAPRCYEGETDLDKIKAQERLAEARRLRYSASGILLIVIGLLLLIVLLMGSRRGSVMSQYGYPPVPAGEASGVGP